MIRINSFPQLANNTNAQKSIKNILAGGVTNGDLSSMLDNIKRYLSDGERIFSPENIVNGLEMASLLDIKDFKLLTDNLSKKNKVFESLDVIGYTNFKNRWEHIDAIIDAKLYSKHLDIPRGFSSASDFSNFSNETKALLQNIDGDIRVQGSSLMDFPEPVKDLDIVVVVTENQFVKLLKKSFGENYYKRFVSNDSPMPSNYIEQISNNEFKNYVNSLNSLSNISSDEVRLLNSLQKGKIPDNSFLNISQKTILQNIQTKYNLPDFDVSILQKDKAFESNPFISIN